MNRAIKEEDLTMTVCLYVTKYNSATISKSEGWMSEESDYVCVSEPLEVTFTPLDDEVVLKARVDCIDNQIEKTRAELTRKVTDLQDQKQRLLAITHEEGS